MILADKIIENRKKNGWSQEELAERLGVSRQSVSKWESAQAVPDMKKILMLSEIFGVTTDYLMKDEITAMVPAETAPVDDGLDGLEETVRRVSMEEASTFLAYNEKAARRVAAGVVLCILSPITVIVLGGLAEMGRISMAAPAAEVAGTIVLLVLIAIAVAGFVKVGMDSVKYDYLEKADIDAEYGVTGMVRERRDRYAEQHSRLLIIGIMLCILSAVPLMMTELAGAGNGSKLLSVASLAILLVMCAAGVGMIVLTCCRQGGYDRLLEEGDYTRLNKRAGKYDGIFWAIATAVYLGWSFVTMNWKLTWIVWPIAGVLYAAYREIMKAIIRGR